jgi:hypothetical protein
MTVHLVAHNGKETTFEQALTTPGCDPRATLTIRRRGRRATLVSRMKAAREGPGLKSFALRLPKTLSRGRVRPFVLADGRRMKPLSRKRLATMPFPAEVRGATLVWRGLRTGRRLRRTAVVKLSMTDGRNVTTTLKPRVPVRGKRPRRR